MLHVQTCTGCKSTKKLLLFVMFVPWSYVVFKQVISATSDVAVVLHCYGLLTASLLCSPESATVHIFGRPDISLDANLKHQLVLDIRSRTQLCLSTRQLQIAPINGQLIQSCSITCVATLCILFWHCTPFNTTKTVVCMHFPIVTSLVGWKSIST